jgi:hypothetical protein
VISESGSFRNAGMKWLKSRFTFRFQLAFNRVAEQRLGMSSLSLHGAHEVARYTFG